MKKPVIEVNNFSYSFGNGDVVSSVDFDVEKGEYISIVGPNGAGKTTLLKNIMRILTGGRGVIKVKGIDIKRFDQRELAKEISYVPQPDVKRYPFQVWEFILMGKYPHLNPFSKITTKDEHEVDAVLESVHMSHFKNRDMNTLSSGERQKIMICASLVQKADIFLLDEPTTFLDPKHEEEINKILKRLNREHNITILSVTHNINLAAMLGDKILGLKDGHLVYFGSSDDFMNRGVLSRIYDKEFELMTHPEKNIKIILPDLIC